jgi:hypothetical protein
MGPNDDIKNAVVKLVDVASKNQLSPCVGWLSRRCAYVFARLFDIAKTDVGDMAFMQFDSKFHTQLQTHFVDFVKAVMVRCEEQSSLIFSALTATHLNEVPSLCAALFKTTLNAKNPQLEAAEPVPLADQPLPLPAQQPTLNPSAEKGVPVNFPFMSAPMKRLGPSVAQYSVPLLHKWPDAKRFGTAGEATASRAQEEVKQRADEYYNGIRFLIVLLTKLNFNCYFLKAGAP